MSKRREAIKADIYRRKIVELMAQGYCVSRIAKEVKLSYRHTKLIVDQETASQELKPAISTS